MDYQTTIKAKRDAVAQAQTDQKQQDALASTVVNAITEKGVRVYAQIDAKADAEELTVLNDITAALTQLQKLEESGKVSGDKLLADVIQAIKKIDIKPIVNVPRQLPPQVDFTPLQRTIEQCFKPDESARLDLDDYKAQDIKDGDTVQYVGFLNPQGNWYIIENDIQVNSMRYVFGSGGYAKAFKKAAQYQYKLLDEAINATA